jgi:hypothetical protein
MTNAQMAVKIKYFFIAKLLARLPGGSFQKATRMSIEQINGRIQNFVLSYFLGPIPSSLRPGISEPVSAMQRVERQREGAGFPLSL